jgi:hypothetical protein
LTCKTRWSHSNYWNSLLLTQRHRDVVAHAQ